MDAPCRWPQRRVATRTGTAAMPPCAKHAARPRYTGLPVAVAQELHAPSAYERATLALRCAKTALSSVHPTLPEDSRRVVSQRKGSGATKLTSLTSKRLPLEGTNLFFCEDELKIPAGRHSTVRAHERHFRRLEAELNRRALARFYAVQFNKWCDNYEHSYDVLGVWRQWTMLLLKEEQLRREFNRIKLATAIIAQQRIYKMALKLRARHPAFYKLKIPPVPKQASMGAVLGLFSTPIIFGVFAFLAGWTDIAVLLAWLLPSNAILAALVTPLPDPPSLLKVHSFGGSCIAKLSALANSLSSCLGAAATACFTLLNDICGGKFHEVFANFVQCCMGLAAALQINDALGSLQNKPAASLIGFLIVAVQFPDFLGWLFGEVWRVQCVVDAVEKMNEVVNGICRSVEARAETVVRDVTTMAIAIKEQLCARQYNRLEAPRPEPANGSESDEEAQAATSESPAAESSKQNTLHNTFTQINDLGMQVRQSPFKMLTAIADFIMMLDEIEATREGSSPWYYLTIDALGFLATFAATTGYVRQITREKEYNEGLVNEAARLARKTLRAKAEKRLQAALAPPLLQMDCDEIEAAAKDGEESELPASVVSEARITAQNAREAQIRWREDQEAQRRRFEQALQQLVKLRAPPLLNIECEKLQLAIVEGEAVGLNPADIGLAVERHERAVKAQRARAQAESQLETAMSPCALAPGLPESPLLRIDLAALDEALEVAVSASVRLDLVKAARHLRKKSGQAQQKMTTVLTLVVARLKKMGAELKKRELARLRLAEAELKVKNLSAKIFALKGDRPLNASVVAQMQKDAHAARDSLLLDAFQELRAAIEQGEALGVDVGSASATLYRIQEVTASKIRVLDRIVPAMRAVSSALNRLAELSQNELEGRHRELFGAVEEACKAALDEAITENGKALCRDLLQVIHDRTAAAERLQRAIEDAQKALIARSASELQPLAQRIDGAVGAARAVKWNEAGPPSMVVSLELKEQLVSLAHLLQVHEQARRAFKPFESYLQKEKQLRGKAESLKMQGPAMMALREAGHALEAALEAAAVHIDPQVTELDARLLEQMQAIYSDYDKALEYLEKSSAKCDDALIRWQRQRDGNSLRIAVEDLEKAVFAARDAHVERERILSAQKSLTIARASLRAVKEQATTMRGKGKI